MAEARGDALEWAMALAKAPAARGTLRERPLPHGMELLLQVAAGSSHDALAEFAAQSGESEADVVDAARFYAREMLFHQGADAYRVLGVEHDAETDTIRTHHRLLQQWLHPDRHTSDWDAIFAARVNAAWSRLRSDQRRQAYDRENPPRERDQLPANLGSPTWLHPQQAVGGDLDPGRWQRRAPVLALFAVCALLTLLAVRDMQREPVELDAFHAADATDPEADAGHPADAQLALRIPARASGAAGDPKPAAPSATPATKPVTAVALAKPPRQPASERSARPAQKPVAAAAVPAVPAKPVRIAVASPARPAPKSVAAVAVVKPPSRAVVAPPPAKPSSKPVAVAVVKPLPKPSAVAVLKPLPKSIAAASPAKPASKPVAVAVVKPLPKPIAAVPPAKPVAKPVAALAVAKPLPKPVAAGSPAKPAAKPIPTVAVMKPLPKPGATASPATGAPKPVAAVAVVKPPTKSVAVAAPAKPVAKPAATPRQPAPGSVEVAQKNPAEPASEVAPAKVAVASKPPLPAPRTVVAAAMPTSAPEPASAAVESRAVAVQRTKQAQQVGGQLMSYMSKSGSVIPPIWGSLNTQRGAAQLRGELHEAGKVKLDAPHWRVSDGTASLVSVIRYEDGRVGRLAANLSWREQRWWVTGLSVERDL